LSLVPVIFDSPLPPLVTTVSVCTVVTSAQCGWQMLPLQARLFVQELPGQQTAPFVLQGTQLEETQASPPLHSPLPQHWMPDDPQGGGGTTHVPFAHVFPP
jgi:hypothetical protein